MTTDGGATAPSGEFVLPVTNQQVTLRSVSGYEYAAWVLEVGIRAITLTRSAPSLDEPIPDPGDAMELCWPIEHGEQVLAVAFIGNQRPDSELLWDVRPTGGARRHQRRNYPRVLTFSPAQISPAKGEPRECMLLDANEVALRVHLAASLKSLLANDEFVKISFDLGGSHFDAAATVMRITPAEDGAIDVVLTFDEEDSDLRARLRSSVAEEFSRQESAPWVS